MSLTAAAKAKRMRGAILGLLQTNHDEQQSRMDSTALWSALVRGLAFDMGRNEVLTLLQDLCDRQYVRYRESRNLNSNVVTLMQIELTARGRDLLEGTIEDHAVEL